MFPCTVRHVIYYIYIYLIGMLLRSERMPQCAGRRGVYLLERAWTLFGLCGHWSFQKPPGWLTQFRIENKRLMFNVVFFVVSKAVVWDCKREERSEETVTYLIYIYNDDSAFWMPMLFIYIIWGLRNYHYPMIQGAVPLSRWKPATGIPLVTHCWVFLLWWYPWINVLCLGPLYIIYDIYTTICCRTLAKDLGLEVNSNKAKGNKSKSKGNGSKTKAEGAKASKAAGKSKGSKGKPSKKEKSRRKQSASAAAPELNSEPIPAPAKKSRKLRGAWAAMLDLKVDGIIFS